MKFWKIECPDALTAHACIQAGTLPGGTRRAESSSASDGECDAPLGLQVGDGVVLGTLIGERAEFFAVGAVVDQAQPRDAWPKVALFKSIKTTFPAPGSDLDNWQRRRSFELPERGNQAFTEVLRHLQAQAGRTGAA